MKHILRYSACLLIAGMFYWLTACNCFNSGIGGGHQDYLVTLPPGATKSGSIDLFAELNKWAANKQLSLIPDSGFVYGKEKVVGQGYVLKGLSKEQALRLKTLFGIPFPNKSSKNKVHLVVSPVRPAPFVKACTDIMTKTVADTTWAVDLVVPAQVTLPRAQIRTPVLYVVDSGVQPIPPAGGWHNQCGNMTDSHLGLNQGRVVPHFNNWPPPSTVVAAPWYTANDDPLDFTGCTVALATGYDETQFTDPQRDSLGHGTNIASTAIGASVGILSKIKTSTGAPVCVRVESIRVGTTADPTNVDIFNGINLAIQAHQGHPGEAAVLLLASNILPPDDNIEIALLDAWQNNGITCVVAAGNRPGPTQTNQYHSPNWLWYDASYNLVQSTTTSPSRYNYSVNPPAPAWPYSPAIAHPTSRYLIIAGGDGATWNTTTQQVSSAGTWWGALGGGTDTGSSRGGEVDIIAPAKAVPCAQPDGTTSTETGTSLSAGFVAGAVLAYMAVAQDFPTPGNCRAWLLPPTSVANLNAAPCKQSTASAWHYAGHASPYYTAPATSPYGNCVPKLQINNASFQ